MTLKRFCEIVGTTGLQPTYFATNLGNNRIVKIMRLLRRIRPLQEYFTASVYGIWRKP